MSDQRFKKAAFGAWVGIVGNLALAAVKFIFAVISGSGALMAESVHSASDVAGSIAVLIGLKIAQKPADADHPYGHGKAETISAIVVSMLLILVGLQLVVNAIKSLFEGPHTPGDQYYLAFWVTLFAIVVKESMFQYKYRLGKKLNSQAIIANAWEHRSDAYSSIAGLIGIGGAWLGVYFHVPFLYNLDPIAGLVVSGFVLHMGYKLIMESIHLVMDLVLPADETKEMYDLARSVGGVLSVDDLLARLHGHYVIIDLRISVDPSLTVLEGHTIGKNVKRLLVERFQNVEDVFVHLNPYDPAYPKQRKSKKN
jgi:cation diffusion facilitator family transporter